MDHYAGAMDIFTAQAGIATLLYWLLLGVKVFAFVNSLTWQAEAYTAAGKLTKPAWAAILGCAVLASLFLGWGIIGIVLTVAALVYLADVRPALKEITAGRR